MSNLPILMESCQLYLKDHEIKMLGRHAIFRFKNDLGASVIDDATWGGYELAVIKFTGDQHHLIEDPFRGLTKEEVEDILFKLQSGIIPTEDLVGRYT